MQKSCSNKTASASPTGALGPKAETVYRQLRERIERGDYRPGDRLPTQQALSAELGMSNVTVHRAMARLIADGLVVARQGAGVFVTRRPDAERTRIISYMYAQPDSDLVRVQNMALSLGYSLSVFCEAQNKWNPAAERLFLQQVKDQRHHALLAFCSPTEPRNDALLAELEASGVRVLHMEHYRDEPPDQPYLLPDFDRAGHMAVMSLLLAGYAPVYLLSLADPPTCTAPYVRLVHRGFGRAMQDHLPNQPESSWWLPFFTREKWPTRLPELCRQLPDGAGIVSLVGENATLIRDALREHGRDVPGQIGLIAIDVAGNPPGPEVDILSFRRPRLLQRAMDEVMRDDWSRAPRELVAPVRQARGTIRSRRT